MKAPAMRALDALLRAFGDATVQADEVALPVDSAPEDDRQATFVAYAGLVDALTEAALSECREEDRRAFLSAALAGVGAAEGPLRFARHERGTATERNELVARMRGKGIALTSRWLVPRLRSDIESYERRIEALRRAVEAREA